MHHRRAASRWSLAWLVLGAVALAACSHGGSSATSTSTTSTTAAEHLVSSVVADCHRAGATTVQRCLDKAEAAAEDQRTTALAAVVRLQDPTPAQEFDMASQWRSTEAAFTAYRTRACHDVELQLAGHDAAVRGAECRVVLTRQHLTFLQGALPEATPALPADPLVQTPQADCPGPTTADLVSCNTRQVAALDGERSAVVKTVAAHAPANPSGEVPATSWGATRDAFLAYRTIACTTLFDQNRDGTIAPVLQAACQVALTRDHLQFLRQVLVDQGVGPGPVPDEVSAAPSPTDTPAASASCLLHAFLQQDRARATTCANTAARADALFKALSVLPRERLVREAADPGSCVPYPGFQRPDPPNTPDGTYVVCPFGDGPGGQVGVWMIVGAFGPPYYVVDIGPE